MTPRQNEALSDLVNGGKIVTSVEGAKEICSLLEVQFAPEKLVLSWASSKEAYTKYALFPESPYGQGVSLLDLSYHILDAWGVSDFPGSRFTGRGYQGRANGELIRQLASEKFGPEIRDEHDISIEIDTSISID